MFPLLGLKGSSDRAQIDDRLQYHPQVYEFFTSAADFSDQGYRHLTDAIEYVKSRGVKHIVLHHPMQFKQWHTELVAPENQFPDLYHFVEDSTMKLIRLAYNHDVQCLVHGSYAKETLDFIRCYPSLLDAQKAAYARMDRFQRAGGQHIMFENSISPIFSYGDPETEDIILDHHYRLAFDTSHCFIYLHGNNAGLQASLKHLGPQVVHYHLVDSMGVHHDSLPLGKGKIDWQAVLPLLNPQASSIYEINLADNNNCAEQMASHHYLQQLVKQQG